MKRVRAGQEVLRWVERNPEWILVAVPFLYVLAVVGTEVVGSGGLLLGGRQGDLAIQSASQRDFGFGELARGHFPLWNPHIFSGMPAFGNVQLALCYPLNVVFSFLPLGVAVNLSTMLHLTLAGVFMGAWTRSRGVGLLPAVTAGILYLGCGAQYSHVLAGHLTMICLFPWAPLLFWSVDAVVCEGCFRPALAGVAATAMMLLAGYPQFVFHLGLAAALYGALRLARTTRRLRKLLLLVLIPVLAVGVSALQLAAAVQAKAGTLRDGLLPFSYAAKFSLAPENLLTLLTPLIFGGLHGEGYWGRWLLWEMNLFFGITGLVMALAALARRADHDRWPLFGLALLMLVLALGAYTPLFRVFYDHVPPFGSFRGHSKWIVPASLFLILLASQGFDEVLNEPKRFRALSSVLVAVGSILGISAALLGAAVRGGVAPRWWTSLLMAIDRSGESFALTPDLLRDARFLQSSLEGALVAVGLAAATLLILSCLLWAARRRRRWGAAVLGLAILEMFLFDRAYLAMLPLEDARRPDVAVALQRDPGDYRVHVLGVPNSAMSTGVSDVWGYDPFAPRRYAEFMASCQGVPLDTPAEDIPFCRWDPLLALLRLRYILAPPEAGATWVEGPFSHLPHALLVPEFEVVSGPRERALGAMRRVDFDPYRTAILEELPPLLAGLGKRPVRQGSRALVRRVSTDELVVEADSGGPALLLLTDPYFPGWVAEALPGSAQDSYQILRADYILQAIPVGAGRHRIRLSFVPPNLTLWGAVSLCTIIGLVFAGSATLLRRNGQRGAT